LRTPEDYPVAGLGKALAGRLGWFAAALPRRTLVLAEGTVAPPFKLPDQDGSPVSLDDFRGRWVVFWWFPKAFTAG